MMISPNILVALQAIAVGVVMALPFIAALLLLAFAKPGRKL